MDPYIVNTLLNVKALWSQEYQRHLSAFNAYYLKVVQSQCYCFFDP